MCRQPGGPGAWDVPRKPRDIVRKCNVWGQFHARLQSSSVQAARCFLLAKAGTNTCFSCKEQEAESIAAVGKYALGRYLQNTMFHTGGKNMSQIFEGHGAPCSKAKAAKVSADSWQVIKENLAQKLKLAWLCLGRSSREEGGEKVGDHMFS